MRESIARYYACDPKELAVFKKIRTRREAEVQLRVRYLKKLLAEMREHIKSGQDASRLDDDLYLVDCSLDDITYYLTK